MNKNLYKDRSVTIWRRLQKVNQIIQRRLQRDFCEKGITTAQFELLAALRKHKALSMKRISEILTVTGGNVTGLIDRLEKKGLAKRQRSKKDRRVINVTITPEGDRVYDQVIDEFEENLFNILSELSNGDLEEFYRILDELYLRLKRKYGEEEEERD